jgi:hypothetical protein
VSGGWVLHAVDCVQVRSVRGQRLWTHPVPADVRPYRFELPGVEVRATWPEMIEIVYLSDGRVTERHAQSSMRGGGTIVITISAPRRPSDTGWPP